MNNKVIKVYCDGGARGNPGPAASAFLAVENGKTVHEESKPIGKATNNVAEYTAVLMAFKWLENDKIMNRKIQYFLDSKLIVNQLSGIFKVKDKKLIRFHTQIKSLEKSLTSDVSYSYIPREKNEKADALVNKKLSTKFTLSRSGD